jgi:membrane associated rhomboid family serine protease
MNTEECRYGFEVGDARLCAASMSRNPMFGPATQVFIDMGGMLGYKIVEKKELWRLIAPVYLHVGVIHFAFNMLVLLQFGIELEAKHGSFRMALVYLMSGVFGCILGAIFSGNRVSVGASGALFGLIGASLGDLIQNWAAYERPCSNFVWLLVISLVQLLIGTMPMLDNFAHFFGFCMGFMSSLALFILKRVTRSGRQVKTKCHQRILQILAVSMIPFLFIVAIMVLFAGNGHELCPECKKISCLPFPWGCDTSQPTGSGTCWWNCDMVDVDPRCRATSIVSASPTNATVVVHCPVGDSFRNVTRNNVDVSTFDQNAVMKLCADLCVG